MAEAALYDGRSCSRSYGDGGRFSSCPLRPVGGAEPTRGLRVSGRAEGRPIVRWAPYAL